MSHSQTAVIIPAAGSGERLGMGVPKALVELAGETLIHRAVRNLASIAELIIVAAPIGSEDEIARAIDVPNVQVVSGGPRRSQSVANAIKALPSNFTYVLVHDAARAFAPTDLAQRILNELIGGAEAVIPALDVVDTIKVVDSESYVVNTPDRTSLRAIQTPQGFTREVITRAHAAGKDATDDAALVAELGVRVKVIKGDPLARKITTLDDLAWAKELVGHS